MRVRRGEIRGALRTSDFQSGRCDLMGILLGRAESMAARSRLPRSRRRLVRDEAAQTNDSRGRARALLLVAVAVSRALLRSTPSRRSEDCGSAAAACLFFVLTR